MGRDMSSRKPDDYARAATRTEAVGIAVNFFLFLFKLAAGIIGRSSAMLSDAIHTASDVFADLIAIIGLQVSNKDSDEEHPYGHEKIECIFTAVLGIVLLGVGYTVGRKAVTGIIAFFSGTPDAVPRPGLIALIAAVVSIAAKELLYRYVLRKAKALQSPTLKATAWHHRSDALSSVGALIGVAGAKFGITVLDAVASAVICILVLKIGIEVLVGAIRNLIDTAAPMEERERIREISESVPGVEKVVNLTTRQFGHRIYAEITIGCDGRMSLEEGHAVAEKVHNELEKEFPNIKHVFVHVDPV